MHSKTCCAATGIRTKMSTVEVSLGYLIFLPILLLYAIIALAIIAESFGKFLLPRDKEKFAENFGEFKGHLLLGCDIRG